MKRALRDQTAIVWLLVAIIIAAAYKWIPNSAWLIVHLTLLGALSHSVMVWSEHFTKTLLRAPGIDGATGRYATLALGSLIAFISMPANFWVGVLAGATIVSVAVTWHFIAILRLYRRALPSRFRDVTHYYMASALFLPIGAGFGATLAYGLGDTWHARFLASHIIVNLFGWIGLTVIGTLVTFWPTLLRARMDQRAEKLAATALPVFVIAIAIAVTGALIGTRLLVLAGLLTYTAGILWAGRAMIHPLKKRGITEFAPASVATGLAWAIAGMVYMSIKLTQSWEAFADSIFTTAAIFAIGFALQILLGALTHLFPLAVGGGPAGSRAALSELGRLATWRLTVTNLGLALLLLPFPHWLRVGLAALVVLSLALFLPFLIRGLRAAQRAKRARSQNAQESDTPGEASPAQAPASPPLSRTLVKPGQFVGGVLAITVALSFGVALNPDALALSPNHLTAQPSSSVAATGETTEVSIIAKDMRFTPSNIDVPVGNNLVITVKNEDDVHSHDLVVGDARTKRLLPGETQTLEIGVITANTEGWCSIAGHRQMGMVLNINAIGPGAQDPGVNSSKSDDEGAGHEQHEGSAITPDLDTPLTETIDPELPPKPAATTHKMTFEVTEEPLEVAPGIWQTRWTFNGKSMGPTLRGKIGDKFEITLVNKGTMGHSIDFHAGELAPDQPMRTIAPGEQLKYSFTATRAGIWLYHCATHPMATHIAAGMHGTVIIEPEHLEPVEHEYVFVQSEIYLEKKYSSKEEALEVNADKVLAEAPDLMAFNGIADQYMQHPIEVPAGERVRIWLMDAGPTRALPFHIVGTQFDTTWTEGAYQLKDGKDAFGYASGGAQVLPLLAAQGGFVELTFPEPGTYTAVNHAMIDGEKGARATFKVVQR